MDGRGGPRKEKLERNAVTGMAMIPVQMVLCRVSVL